VCEAAYLVPGDAIHLRTNDLGILRLADRLWDRAPAGAPLARRRVPIALSLEVTDADHVPPPALFVERWSLDADDARLSLGENHVHGHIESRHGRFSGRVSAALVADHPALVSRLLLETPAAALLARRGYCVVHAGAVVGPAGAVVIRGRGGAGKSTLVAAAHGAGLRVLGDESVLVERGDPDALLAGVRDVTVLPDAARLLGIERAVTRAGTAREEKCRLDLFTSSTPALRRARRVATVLLGPRHGGPARLESLAAREFLEEFREGEIPQERRFETPGHVAVHWSRGSAYRLSGANDLPGAVALLADLVARPAAARLA
jgi:hypothetical protein